MAADRDRNRTPLAKDHLALIATALSDPIGAQNRIIECLRSVLNKAFFEESLFMLRIEVHDPTSARCLTERRQNPVDDGLKNDFVKRVAKEEYIGVIWNIVRTCVDIDYLPCGYRLTPFRIIPLQVIDSCVAKQRR